jgi:DNA-binding CsgD family transcriptional regulator
VTDDVQASIAALLDLTHRERELFAHLAAGRYPRDIAARLNVTPKTVYTYIDRLRLKLHGRPCELRSAGELRAHAAWLRDHVQRVNP